MIIIEIFFAKINNPQQNTKHFAEKNIYEPMQTIQLRAQLGALLHDRNIEPPTSTFRTSAAPFVHM